MNKLFESLQYLDDEMLTEEAPAAAPKRLWLRWAPPRPAL